MRLLKLTAIFIAFSTTAFAQLNDCTNLNKAIEAAAANFVSYTNFQFKTTGGQSAYLADFSLVSNTTAYVYKDDVKQETYSYQKLEPDNSKYTAYYKSIEQCLLKHKYKW